MQFTENHTVLQYLKAHNIQLKKQFGQNFLIDEHAYQSIIDAGDLQSDDHVIEVGPGLGTLSMRIAPHVTHLTLVEKDPDLIPHLEHNLNQFNNITLKNTDILDFPIPDGSYKVIANIPYYITSPIILKFLRAQNRPKKLVLLMQKEVAEKICTVGKGATVLSVLTQTFAVPEKIRDVSRHCFVPAPKVTSTILALTPHTTPRITSPYEQFAKVVKAGFSQKRKMLAHNISATFRMEKAEAKILLEKAGIAIDIRAERVTIEQWDVLTSLLFPQV